MISQLRCIRGIAEHEVVSLLKAGYQDQEDLQKALDDATVPAIERIAKNAKLEPKRVAELLDTSLHQSSDQLSGSWLSKHWADILLLSGFFLLVMLPHLGKLAEEKAKVAKMGKISRVIAERDLLPYTPLKPADLAPRDYASPEEAKKRIVELKDRYPTHFIKAGETVDDACLSKNKVGLNHFSILRVTLKAKPAWEGISLPRNCELLFSAHGTIPGGTKIQVQLLDLTSDGVSATVSVPNEQLSEIAKWVGNSDAYLFFRVQ